MINEQDEKIERLASNDINDFIAKGRDSVIKTFSSKEMRQGMIDATLSSVFYSLNTIVIKQAKEFSPAKFTSFNFALWRGLTSFIALFFYMRRLEPGFNPFANIQKKYWLFIRSVGFYIGWMFFITSIVLLRVSIAQVMGSIAPIVSLIVSVIVLHEKFYLRYLIGILLCFIGSAIIVLNEKGNNSDTAQDPFTFYVGIFAAIMNILLNGYVIVSQKVLMDDGMSNKHQVFFVSLALFCCSMVMCTLTWNFGFDPYIMGLATLNGGFFYYANHYAQESLKVLNVGGTVPFNYLQTIFVFIMCVVILRESIFITDIIGSVVIVSFHGYNSWSPLN